MIDFGMIDKECSTSDKIARRKKNVKQWVKDCVAYWSERIYEGDIGADWDDADVICWRCGHIRQQQKCHIIPKALGGADDATNIIPLCAMCHDEMPNVADPKFVWEWIKNDHGCLYDTYWTMRAITEAGLTQGDLRDFDKQKLSDAYKEIGVHFGQGSGGARTTTATMAWAIRKACGK